MHPRLTRALTAGLTAGTMIVTVAGPAAAQLPDLPTAPPGAVGEILSPLEELLGEITGPLGEGLGDVPFDNAVTLQGDDAVEAAIALSQITFQTSQIAYIGRDDVFADTLSSVAGQGIAGAPLLLTQTDGIDERTATELQRLGVTQVIVLGSTLAVSQSVEDQLRATYGDDNVTRVGGPSRIETAADLAAEIAPTADHAILMRAYSAAGADQSQAYADALSAGPLASDMELPSLLTTTDYLHPATRAYLEDAAVATVTIIGGESAVGPEVEQTLLDMGITVNRVSGANRWDTSILVAREMGIFDAADANRLILTEGGAVAQPLWSAGFAAAAHGAVFESPVILADGPLLPPETISFITDGLVSNALRLSNEPVICNSFVDFLACETAALLTVGTLDEVNRLTGGAIEGVLRPVYEPLRELLEGIIPGAREMGPGLVGQIFGLIGVPGNEETPENDLCNDGNDNDQDGEIDEADECEGAQDNPEARFMDVMAGQPADVRASFTRLVGAQDSRVSPSVQAVLTDVLADLQTAIGGPVDTSDPAQAAALVTILDAITATLGNVGTVPLGELTALLDSVDALVGDLVDTTALAAMVAGLGVDVPPAAEELIMTVTGLIGADTMFTTTDDLAVTYGTESQPLAAAIDRINR